MLVFFLCRTSRIEMWVETYRFLIRGERVYLRYSPDLLCHPIVSPISRTGTVRNGFVASENRMAEEQKMREEWVKCACSRGSFALAFKRSLTTRRTDFFDDSWSSPAMISSSKTEYAFWKLKILDPVPVHVGQERYEFPSVIERLNLQV